MTRYPTLISITNRAAYWQLGPERYQAFSPQLTALPVGVDNGAGYPSLYALGTLKGDTRLDVDNGLARAAAVAVQIAAAKCSEAGLHDFARALRRKADAINADADKWFNNTAHRSA